MRRNSNMSHCFVFARTFALSIAMVTLLISTSEGGFTTYLSAGADPAAITPMRDAFRLAIGGGAVAGGNGSFGGLRREINWDGVGDAFADPNALPGNFFNVNSPRGVVLSTPGTGFAVSSSAGSGTPILYGFPGDFQTFSAQRLFTAINSNVTDVTFFLPGTTTPATTNAFGTIFADVENGLLTKLDFFDENNTNIFTIDAGVAGNQGLSFLGAVANAGERISRVRVTSGLNTIVQNGSIGNPNDDVVVMDDFIYAEPIVVPEPGSLVLIIGALIALGANRSRCRGR